MREVVWTRISHDRRLTISRLILLHRITLPHLEMEYNAPSGKPRHSEGRKIMVRSAVNKPDHEAKHKYLIQLVYTPFTAVDWRIYIS